MFEWSPTPFKPPYHSQAPGPFLWPRCWSLRSREEKDCQNTKEEKWTFSFRSWFFLKLQSTIKLGSQQENVYRREIYPVLNMKLLKIDFLKDAIFMFWFYLPPKKITFSKKESKKKNHKKKRTSVHSFSLLILWKQPTSKKTSVGTPSTCHPHLPNSCVRVPSYSMMLWA